MFEYFDCTLKYDTGFFLFKTFQMLRCPTKQKRIYGSWKPENMQRAILEVKAGYSSLRKAAQKYSVPSSTLSDRVRGKVKEDGVWGSKPKLSFNDEKLLIENAKERASLGIGYSKYNFMQAASAIAKSKSLPFKKENPSEMWWRRLKKRHSSFSLRSPEATASNRHSAMTKERIEKFFLALGRVVEDNNLQPDHIWIMDETGMTLAHKPGKIVAEKGAKTVHAKCSTMRQLVTVIACANASGTTIPPHFIIPGKTKRSLNGYDSEYLQKTQINNANISLSESGWTKDGIGRLWFESTFLPSIGQHRPQLLVCDGHSSHNNVEFIELARKENIIIVELPSHTSHWTQPLDRSFFKSLKNRWNAEVSSFTQITGLPVGHAHFFRLFSKAWESASQPSVIQNGFKATGIFPFNPEAIPEEAYKPASLYTTESTQQTTGHAVQNSTEPSTDREMIDQHNVPTNSISLDVPMISTQDLTSATLMDLPISMDDDGNINVEFLTTEETDIASVTNEKALEVLESTIDSGKLLKFTAALLSKKNINDPLFPAWKMYKEKITDQKIISGQNSRENILALPEPILKNTKSKLNKPETHYFVITADEAYNHKIRVQEKKRQEQMKREEKKIRNKTTKNVSKGKVKAD